jgi:hypothetical protein
VNVAEEKDAHRGRIIAFSGQQRRCRGRGVSLVNGNPILRKIRMRRMEFQIWNDIYRFCAVSLLEVNVEFTGDLGSANLGGDHDRGNAFEGIDACRLGSGAKSIAFSGLSQSTERSVVINDDDGACGVGIGVGQGNVAGIENGLGALLYDERYDEGIGIVVGVVFIKPKDLSAVGAGGSVGIAGGVGPGVGRRANDDSTGCDLRAIRGIGVGRSGEARPLVVAATVDGWERAKTRG